MVALLLVLSVGLAAGQEPSLKPINGLAVADEDRALAWWRRLHQTPPLSPTDLMKELGTVAPDALAAIAASDNSGLDDYALSVLEERKDPLDSQGVERLLPLIAKASEREGIQRQAAGVLGRSAAAIQALRVLAARADALPTARVFASAALAAPGSAADSTMRRTAVEQLLAALGNSDDSSRVAHNALPPIEPWMSQWLLDHVARPDASAMMVEHALELLAGRPPQELRAERRAAFLAGLEKGTVNARMWAAQGLWHLGLVEADLGVYRRIGADPNPYVRRTLYECVSAAPKSWAAPLLLAGLDDSLAENRALCAKGLGTLRYRRAMPRLIELLRVGVAPGARFEGEQQAEGEAIVRILGRKRVVFSNVIECVPVGNDVHALVVQDRSGPNIEIARTLLSWWDNGGHKQFGQ